MEEDGQETCAANASGCPQFSLGVSLVRGCRRSQTQGRGRTGGRAAESSALRSSLAESFRGALRSGQCRKEALQKTLCTMSRPRCARTRSGTRPPRARHPECPARKPFLDFAEREDSKGNAFLVAPARPAIVADRHLPADPAPRFFAGRRPLISLSPRCLAWEGRHAATATGAPSPPGIAPPRRKRGQVLTRFGDESEWGYH